MYSNSNRGIMKYKYHHFKLACNIWLNLCIFLIGTDFWRFIPRDSLKLWSDKSVGGYRTLHTNAKSIYTIDIVVGSKNNAYIIKRIHPQQNIICSSGSLELDQQVCVCLSLFWSSLLHICLLFKNIRWHVWNIHFWNLGMPGTSH